MSATPQAPIIPIKSSSEPPGILLADADVFAARAARFEQLAEGHTLGDWLRFLAVVTRAQDAALRALPALPLPDPAIIARAREHRMPVLPAQSWPRDPAWHGMLQRLAAGVAPAAPEPARVHLDRLATLTGEALEALAERVLHTELYGEDAALLPYVGAALQVLWTGLARKVGAGGTGIGALDAPGVCPCCGFLPVASVVREAGGVEKLRYLHCALCNTGWNLARATCPSCGGDEKVSYRQLEGEAARNADAVRAETCDSCSSYLKIMYRDKGPVDPVADDLATLALDILVDEAGYARAGPNLLLVPGG